MKHELYKQDDKDLPVSLKGQNTLVDRGVCRLCKASPDEIVKLDNCPGANRFPETLNNGEWVDYNLAGDGVAILDNWFLTVVTKNPYQAPETGTLVLGGNVFNHGYFDQGVEITTSKPVSVDPQFPNVVITKSGSRYFLGRVAEEYESQYPGARKRLFNSLAGVRENG